MIFLFGALSKAPRIFLRTKMGGNDETGKGDEEKE